MSGDVLDHVHIEPSEVQESGDYDLEGLFVRLNHAIDSIGAKRVVFPPVRSRRPAAASGCST